MATRDWPTGDDHLPGGSAANTIDTLSQDQSEDVRERDLQGGHRHTITTLGTTNQNNDGKHAVGLEESPPNTANDGRWSIWDSAGTTRKWIFYGASFSADATKQDAFETPGDTIIPATAVYRGGIAVAAAIRVTGYEALPVLNAYTPMVFWKVPELTTAANALSRTLTAAGLIVGSRPVGSSLIAEIRQIDVTDAGFSNAFNRFADGTPSTVANTVTLTAGSDYSVFNTGLSVTFDPGDELVVKWTGIGSTTPAADVTVVCVFE